MANKTSSKKGQGTAPKKMGRPSKKTPELIEEILDRIANGASLVKILKDEHMPSYSNCMVWLDEDKEFQDRYDRAKKQQADYYADELLEISYGTLRGLYDPQAARLLSDNLKWTAMKLRPMKYGDKMDVTSDGKALPQPILAMLTTKKAESDAKRDVIDGEIVPDGQNKKTLPGAEYDAPVQNLSEVEEKTSQNIMDDINGA